EKQFQVGVSKDKDFRAKAKAEVHLRGDQEQQYALLWDYCEALKKANPNATEGFRASGRQLIGLDVAFMKGNYPCQLLTAGLLPALKDLFPAAEHIYCVRHIHDNMNLIYKGGQYKELLWKCATATTEAHFERAMDDFKGKWEVSGIPYKHAVACMFNMNDNGVEVGMPEYWVHQSMMLET
nr:hypothetical protein [Tanacetum cinerariifolium]